MDSVDENPGTTVYSKLAYTLWCKDPKDRDTITLRKRGRRAKVREAEDRMEVLAKEFGLLYTVWPHPSNRWWRRRREAAVLIQGHCDELVQYLNVLDEVETEERGR